MRKWKKYEFCFSFVQNFVRNNFGWKKKPELHHNQRSSIESFWWEFFCRHQLSLRHEIIQNKCNEINPSKIFYLSYRKSDKYRWRNFVFFFSDINHKYGEISVEYSMRKGKEKCISFCSPHIRLRRTPGGWIKKTQKYPHNKNRYKGVVFWSWLLDCGKQNVYACVFYIEKKIFIINASYFSSQLLCIFSCC